MANEIAEKINGSVVGIIGHTLILFRQNPDLDKRIYKLPSLKNK